MRRLSAVSSRLSSCVWLCTEKKKKADGKRTQQQVNVLAVVCVFQTNAAWDRRNYAVVVVHVMAHTRPWRSTAMARRSHMTRHAEVAAQHSSACWLGRRIHGTLVVLCRFR